MPLVLSMTLNCFTVPLLFDFMLSIDKFSQANGEIHYSFQAVIDGNRVTDNGRLLNSIVRKMIFHFRTRNTSFAPIGLLLRSIEPHINPHLSQLYLRCIKERRSYICKVAAIIDSNEVAAIHVAKSFSKAA